MTDPYEKLREICLALPGAVEGTAWGHSVWHAGKPIFAGWEQIKGKWCVNVKLEEPHADLLWDDRRIESKMWLAGKLWVSLEAAKITDWGEIADMVLEGHRLSAPKKSLAKLDALP
jgi:predicted DNA-binding protein (MmcQ/YjbR family)